MIREYEEADLQALVGFRVTREQVVQRQGVKLRKLRMVKG